MLVLLVIIASVLYSVSSNVVEALCQANTNETEGVFMYDGELGCIWADTFTRNDNKTNAYGRCKEVFGPLGQLIEILTEDHQNRVVDFIKEVETNIHENHVGQREDYYWWTGLEDIEDNGHWIWTESKICVDKINSKVKVNLRWPRSSLHLLV